MSRRARCAALLVAVGLLPLLATAPATASLSVDADQRGFSPVIVLDDELFDAEAIDLASTGNGNTVVSWSGRSDGRYGTWFAVREGDGPFGPAREILPGQVTELVVQGATATVGAVTRDGFLLRTLRADGTWGPVTRVPEVGVGPDDGSYQLVGTDGGDLAVWWYVGFDRTRVAVRQDGRWQPTETVPIGAGPVDSLTIDDAGAVDVVYTPPRDQVAASRLLHVRRAPDGAWGRPTELARGSLETVTVAANDAGALAVAWQQVSPDFDYSLRLRQRPAGGTWGQPYVREQQSPARQPAGLHLAADGRLSMVWLRGESRSRLLFATRAVDGPWSAVQDLAAGGFDDFAGNAAGQTAVAFGPCCQLGERLVRCPPSGACTPAATTRGTGYAYPPVFVGPRGTVKLFWAAGCRTEACYATSVRYLDWVP